jgi:hypothetical protein
MFQDEAAIALDASEIAGSGRDQHGALLPVFFRSMDDYKSPEYIYLLAGVFTLTGPSEQAARTLSAVLVLLAVAGMGLLAWSRSRSHVAGLSVMLLAAGTPWLFDLSRLVFEVALVPLALVALLLAVDRADRDGRWRGRDAMAIALTLAVLTYAYAGTRLLAPLLAVALPLASGVRLRFLGLVYATYGVLLVPIGVYALRHPGALTSRLDDTSFVEAGMTTPEIVWRFLGNYASYWNLPAWLSRGDPAGLHIQGHGSLSLVVVVLAAASGVLFLIRRSVFTPFWRFVTAAALLAPVPAAVTDAELHTLRSVALPVCLVALTIPAVAYLVSETSARPRAAYAIGGGLGVVWLVGVIAYADAFRSDGADRRDDFHADVPALIAHGLARQPQLLVPEADLVARNHVLWYLEATGVSDTRIATLPSGVAPPYGNLVFGSTDDCPFACTKVARADKFWLSEETE